MCKYGVVIGASPKSSVFSAYLSREHVLSAAV
jgi:hypothetical protein